MIHLPFLKKKSQHVRPRIDRRVGALLPEEQFVFFLERARYAANRSGAAFCLLAISINPKLLKGAGEEVLAEILERRLRITDDAGYLSDGRIGVVLPDTPEEGAYTVAEDIRELYRQAGGELSYSLYVYPSDFDIDGFHLPQDEAEHSTRPAALPMEPQLATGLPAWKRAFDVFGASCLIVCFSPVLLLTSILVQLSSPGPILFLQKRHGLGGRPFTIYKFRTMLVGANDEKAALRQFSEQDGPAFKLKKDPRVTAIGRFLRSTSIDELPQLFNVLRNDMSLVGPRPLDVEESDDCEPWQRKRLDVTPGLTCIWQVRGRSRVSFADWIRMDLEYVRSITFFSDLKLLLLTVPSVLLRKGAH